MLAQMAPYLKSIAASVPKASPTEVSVPQTKARETKPEEKRDKHDEDLYVLFEMSVDDDWKSGIFKFVI